METSENVAVVLYPRTEGELLTAASYLEAHDIPVFLRNDRFGGLFPGLQIHSYNARALLVPASQADAARALLAGIAPASSEAERGVRPGWPDKVRMVLEALLFGWFIPGRRFRRKAGQDDPER